MRRNGNQNEQIKLKYYNGNSLRYAVMALLLMGRQSDSLLCFKEMLGVTEDQIGQDEDVKKGFFHWADAFLNRSPKNHGKPMSKNSQALLVQYANSLLSEATEVAAYLSGIKLSRRKAEKMHGKAYETGRFSLTSLRVAYLFSKPETRVSDQSDFSSLN